MSWEMWTRCGLHCTLTSPCRQVLNRWYCIASSAYSFINLTLRFALRWVLAGKGWLLDMEKHNCKTNRIQSQMTLLCHDSVIIQAWLFTLGIDFQVLHSRSLSGQPCSCMLGPLGKAKPVIGYPQTVQCCGTRAAIPNNYHHLQRTSARTMWGTMTVILSKIFPG